MDYRYEQITLTIRSNYYLLGISMLIFALLVSALMGLYQEKLYTTYGKHPQEALFYSVKTFRKYFIMLFISISASTSFAIIRTCW